MKSLVLMIKHEPVLLKEVVEGLNVKKGKKFIDATLGTASHAAEIVKLGGFVYGIDADEKMLKLAKKNLEKADPYFKIIHGNFYELGKIAQAESISQVDGVLFDLGVSNIHLTDKERGFSFRNPDAVLDMRLDQKKQSVMAADLLNTLRLDQLKALFSATMKKGESKRLARKIVAKRNKLPFSKVLNLLSVVDEKRKGTKIHPATKAMLALRIAVNSEMQNIKLALPQAVELLKKGGVLAIITFHSTEDKIVKHTAKELENKNLIKKITKKPLTPSINEINKNKKARSAKLRIYEKI